MMNDVGGNPLVLWDLAYEANRLRSLVTSRKEGVPPPSTHYELEKAYMRDMR